MDKQTDTTLANCDEAVILATTELRAAAEEQREADTAVSRARNRVASAKKTLAAAMVAREKHLEKLLGHEMNDVRHEIAVLSQR